MCFRREQQFPRRRHVGMHAHGGTRAAKCVGAALGSAARVGRRKRRARLDRRCGASDAGSAVARAAGYRPRLLALRKWGQRECERSGWAGSHPLDAFTSAASTGVAGAGPGVRSRAPWKRRLVLRTWQPQLLSFAIPSPVPLYIPILSFSSLAVGVRGPGGNALLLGKTRRDAAVLRSPWHWRVGLRRVRGRIGAGGRVTRLGSSLIARASSKAGWLQDGGTRRPEVEA